MAALFFDVDDTLYDQLQPFEQAYIQHFPDQNLNIEELFKYSRKLSDQVFDLSESGAMSADAMKIYRIQKALQAFGKEITSDEALAFQESYENFQKTIKLSDQMAAILDFCRESGHELGLITNGPSKHQAAKINQLGLTKWVRPENIWISAQVKIAKPQREIFDLAKKNVRQLTTDYYYIGDHFVNDIIGASRAGWQAIWLNKRHKTAESGQASGFEYYQVSSEAELYQLLKQLLSEC